MASDALEQPLLDSNTSDATAAGGSCNGGPPAADGVDAFLPGVQSQPISQPPQAERYPPIAHPNPIHLNHPNHPPLAGQHVSLRAVGVAAVAVASATRSLRWTRRKSLLIRKPSKAKLDGHSLETDLMGSWELLRSSPVYVLIAAVPVALACGFMGAPPAATFSMCCLAILPLAGLLGDATEQVAMLTNETIGGLLNATFGNATEIIVSCFALMRGLLTVVQVSLLGSILSNTLLVLGCACFVAGLRPPGSSDPVVPRGALSQVRFNVIAAKSNATLLMIAILGLCVPTLMLSVGQLELRDKADLFLSRGISVMLFCLYLMYIHFQLNTHRFLFEAENSNADADPEPDADTDTDADVDGDGDEPSLSGPAALTWLAVVTVLIAVLSEMLTGAIEGAAEQMGLGSKFVGFVILPIVGNAAEHTSAVLMAYKHKMDLALGIALGSSTQIALFVIPMMVLLAWYPFAQPLDMMFGYFETSVTFIAALIVFMMVIDGETNWLEGVMLLTTYAIICFAFYSFHPNPGASVPHPSLDPLLTDNVE